MAISSIQSAATEVSVQKSQKHSQSASFRGVSLTYAQSPPSHQSKVKDAAEEVTMLRSKDKSRQPLRSRNFRPAVSRQLSEVEKLQNFQEEAGSFVAAKKSRKELGGVKGRSGSGAGWAEASWQELIQKTPDVSERDLQSFYDQLLNRPPETPDQFTDLINEQFPDVSTRFVALRHLRQTLNQQIKLFSNTDMIELGSQAKMMTKLLYWANMTSVDLVETYEAEIKAGLNISEALLLFVKKKLLGGSSSNLRSFYRESVLGYGKKLSKLYQKMIQKYGSENFHSALLFLSKSLSADLQSQSPSVAKAKLQELIDDTYTLNTMTGVHKELARLLIRVKFGGTKRLKKEQLQQVEKWLHGIMLGILNFKEQSFFPKRKSPALLQLLRNLEFRPSDLSKKINFMTGLREVMRMVPLKMFDDEIKRLEMLRTFQATVDSLIEEEL